MDSTDKNKQEDTNMSSTNGGKYISQTIFVWAFGAVLTIGISLNGFLMNKMYEIERTANSAMPRENTITRKIFEVSINKQEQAIERIREDNKTDHERLVERQLNIEKRIAILCTKEVVAPFSCDN